MTSVVLLLRKPHYFDADELRLACERAWYTSFAGSTDDSMHCVVQSGEVTLLKAGPHALILFFCSRPYIENHRAQVGWLPQPSQRQAWVEHTAFAAIDYLNTEVDLELAYSVLCQLASEMLDGNCTGVYIPGESRLMPHDGQLYIDLREFASSRDSGVGTSAEKGC